MDKMRYFEVLDLFKNYCDLCVDDFEMFTLEEQNASLDDFITKYDYCEMDNYYKILWGAMQNIKENGNNEDLKKLVDLLFAINLHCQNGIDY